MLSPRPRQEQSKNASRLAALFSIEGCIMIITFGANCYSIPFVEGKMAENDELTVKRQQLKTEMHSGKYKSLGGFMLDGVGYLVQKILFSKKQPPFWYNSSIFALLTMLVCFLVPIVFLGMLRY